MSFSAIQMVAPQQLGSLDATIYTCPTLSTAIISRAVFTNTTGSAVTITVGITTGGALSAAQTMISAQSVAAGAAYVSPELTSAVLPAGSVIRAYAGTASAITVEISGVLGT